MVQVNNDNGNGNCSGNDEVHVAVLLTNGMVSDNRNNSLTHNKNDKGDIHIITPRASNHGRGKKPALGDMWRNADIHFVLEPSGGIKREHEHEHEHGATVISESTGRGLDDLTRVAMKRVQARLEKDSNGHGDGDG